MTKPLTRWRVDDRSCGPNCPTEAIEDETGPFIYEQDIPPAVLTALDQGLGEALAEVAELLTERPNWHDAELNRLLAWFHSVQDLNPKYLESGDFVLAKGICERLGYRVDSSIELGASQAQKETK